MVVEFFKRRAVVGHRGYPRLELENTLDSITAALRHGAEVVEVDVQTTADGVVVLSHDETLERTFGVAVDVRRSTWSEVKKIQRGKYRVATLKEALETIGGRAGVFIEVKNPLDVDTVLEVIKEVGAERWAAVISFHDAALERVEIYKGLIYAQPPGRVADAKRLGCHFVLPHFRLVTARSIAFTHRLGLYVVAWTVNQPEKARELWSLGVDGVATDDVENIKKALR
ncbi:MAG: glycerophosphodiester phosphodiesterase [Pyrobaculum sp.]